MEATDFFRELARRYGDWGRSHGHHSASHEGVCGFLVDLSFDLVESLGMEAMKRERAQWYLMTIDDLDIPVRPWNCLRDRGILNVGLLLEHTRKDLLRIKNMGPWSVREIEVALDRHGLKLADHAAKLWDTEYNDRRWA